MRTSTGPLDSPGCSAPPIDLPLKIKIGHRCYTVIDWDASDAHDEMRYGMIRPARGEIAIADGYPDCKRAEVVIHEILHGIVENYGIDLSEIIRADDVEERLVCVFSAGLAAVLADNPGLLDYFHNVWHAQPKAADKDRPSFGWAPGGSKAKAP